MSWICATVTDSAITDHFTSIGLKLLESILTDKIRSANMRKIKFVIPQAIDRKRQNSLDPRDYIPVELDGYQENEDYVLAVSKDPRGLWKVFDVRTGRFLNGTMYRTRRDAVESLPVWRDKLSRFARQNPEYYQDLCKLCDTLWHEFEVISRGGKTYHARIDND